MTLDEMVGKRFTHPDLGNVEVVSKEDKSRTKVLVKVLDKGKGFNEQSGTYKGVRISTGWYRGENREYGNIDIVHKNTLKYLEDDED